MNIHFFTDNPIENAKYLDDNRLKKMIIENFQMFTEALAAHGCPDHKLPKTKSGNIYKYGSPHKNHPSNVWLRQSRSNFMWLIKYTEAMWRRYQAIPYKGNENVPANLARVKKAAKYIPEGPLTKFANCAAKKDAGIDYTYMNDVFLAYQMYMNDRWDGDSKQPTWRGIDAI